MRRVRATLVAALSLVLVGACSNVPGDSPEAFFTRCMAARGIEVSEVSIDASGGFSFSPTERGGSEYDAAVMRCSGEMGQRFPEVTALNP